jgi:hypothetical protein
MLNAIVAINPEQLMKHERDKTNLIKTIQFTAFQYLKDNTNVDMLQREHICLKNNIL